MLQPLEMSCAQKLMWQKTIRPAKQTQNITYGDKFERVGRSMFKSF